MFRAVWQRVVVLLSIAAFAALWPDTSVAAPRRPVFHKSPYQICTEKCDARKMKDLRACEDPSCEQTAQDTAQSCRNDCSLSPEQQALRASHPPRILGVKHHPQSTPVWCWAASIAMVAEFLDKRPVSDCEVASKLDRATGGEGFCCDSRGNLLKERCFRGGRTPDMTTVMSFYGLNPTQLNRALTWDEVRQSIDSEHPIVIGLDLTWSGHAEVIVGYRAPGTLLVLDPWQGRMARPSELSYLALAGDGTMADSWRGMHPWKVSWVFSQSLVQGEPSRQLSQISRRASSDELAGAAPKGPARSTVEMRFPALTGDAKAYVEKAAARRTRSLGACYDEAIAQGTAVPSHATLRLSFGIEQKAPSFVMTKDSGGLPPSVVGCVSTAFAAWSELFPSGGYDDSQRVEVTFQKLP